MLHQVHSFAVNAILLLTLNYGLTAAVSPTTTPHITNLIAANESSLDTILSCSTDLDDSVALYFTQNKGEEKEIYQQYQFTNDNKSKYKVSRNNVSASNTTYYVLGTEYVREHQHHAGEYFCSENNGIGGAKLSASFLTVFDSKPKCKSCDNPQSNSKSISLSCEIPFTGHAENVTILWSKKSNGHELLMEGRLTEVENTLRTEIDVTPESGTTSEPAYYVIHVGYDCRNEPSERKICFVLETELQVPGAQFDKTTTPGYPETSTCPTCFSQTIGIVLIVQVAVVLLVIICTCILVVAVLAYVRRKSGGNHTQQVLTQHEVPRSGMPLLSETVQR